VVIADTVAAKMVRRAADVWDEGDNAKVSSATIAER
jgi:hypothetical protein